MNDLSTNITEFLMLAIPVALLVGLPVVAPTFGIVILLLAGRVGAVNRGTSVVDAALFILVGLAIAAPFQFRVKNQRVSANHPAFWALVVFVVVVATSVISIPDSPYAREKVFRVVVYGPGLFLLPFVYLRDSERIRRYLLAFATVVTMLGVVSLIVTVRAVGFSGIQRIAMPGGGSITLARAVGFAAIACVGLAMMYPRFRILWLANMVFLTALCFATGSRAPALALVAALGCTFMLASVHATTRRDFWKILVVLGLSAILVLPFGASITSGSAPFINRFALLLQDDKGVSVEQRQFFFRYALQISSDTRWTGIGPGGWARIVEGVDEISYPHNVFLEILVEQGLIGVSAFVVYLCLVLITGFRSLRASRHLLSSSVLIVALSSFLYSILIAQTSGDLFDNRYIWFFGGLVLLACKVTQQSGDSPDGPAPALDAANVWRSPLDRDGMSPFTRRSHGRTVT